MTGGAASASRRRYRRMPSGPTRASTMPVEPADDDAAVREFERLRRAGADFMVFGWPAFWWLDHYPLLRRHLSANFPRTLADEDLVVFDIRMRVTWPIAAPRRAP